MGLYVPADPSNTEAARIAQAFSSPDDYKRLNELNALPRKYGDGTVLFMSAALAASLSLSGGRGVYVYYGSTWVKIDQPAGWRDILGLINPKTVGANVPVLTVYAGGNVREMAFVANDLIDFVYHIPHDYLPGSDLFVHVHWSHNGTSISGNAVFDVYSKYAKGHNQANYSAEKNVTITYATTDIATTPQYRHRIDEVQLSSNGGSATLIDSSTLEPDGLVLLQMKLTTLPTIGGGGSLFVHTVDLHYRSTNVATLNRVPNFYL